MQAATTCLSADDIDLCDFAVGVLMAGEGHESQLVTAVACCQVSP